MRDRFYTYITYVPSIPGLYGSKYKIRTAATKVLIPDRLPIDNVKRPLVPLWRDVDVAGWRERGGCDPEHLLGLDPGDEEVWYV